MAAHSIPGSSPPDPGVAAGRLDQDGVLVDPAAFQGIVDHGEADPVFHAGQRIEEFELEEDFSLGSMRGRGAVEAHERRVADCSGDVIVYFRLGMCGLEYLQGIRRDGGQIA